MLKKRVVYELPEMRDPRRGASSPRGFDYAGDSDRSKEILRGILEFLRPYLSAYARIH